MKELATKRFNEFKGLIAKYSYQDVIDIFSCHNVTDESADYNYKETCLTINNVDGRAVLSNMVEVYENDIWVGFYKVSA